MLDVHAECDRLHKQKADHWLSLLQKMYNLPHDQWPDSGHIRSMPAFPAFVTHPDIDMPIPALTNANELIEGAWNWVRGLHAALYGHSLPTTTRHVVLPPVPAFSLHTRPTLQEAEEYSRMILNTVEHALRIDKWDGLRAWGDCVEYTCVWRPYKRDDQQPIWVALWGLSSPGILEWSQSVLPTGSPRPWHGHYHLQQLPEGASALTAQDILRE